jgi:two-component system, LytTR family, response regulator
MTKLRILIVDDEPLARARVRAFLVAESSVEISDECGTGTEALAKIKALQPDIVFLDVQMPESDGMQVLAGLPAHSRPAIVLVTAHDKFAVGAFDEQVVDFLLKPFDRQRFKAALDRAAEHVRSRREGDLRTRLESLLASAPGKPERLAVKTDGRVVFLNPSEITWVEAANNYSILHLSNTKRLMLRETLSSIEKRIGNVSFARVNRSAIVHVDQVRELQPLKYGDHMVVLRDGTRLPLSRNLRGRIGNLAPDAR